MVDPKPITLTQQSAASYDGKFAPQPFVVIGDIPQVSDVEADLSTVQGDISSLQSALAALEARVTALEP